MNSRPSTVTERDDSRAVTYVTQPIPKSRKSRLVLHIRPLLPKRLQRFGPVAQRNHSRSVTRYRSERGSLRHHSETRPSPPLRLQKFGTVAERDNSRSVARNQSGRGGLREKKSWVVCGWRTPHERNCDLQRKDLYLQSSCQKLLNHGLYAAGELPTNSTATCKEKIKRISSIFYCRSWFRCISQMRHLQVLTTAAT